MLTLNELLTWSNMAQMDYEKLEKVDQQELIRLNHLVMETAHNIHNTNMLRRD